MEKFQIFDENHGPTPLEKLSRLFDFFNFLILESKNSFFLSRIIIVKHILLADFAKNENMGKFQIFYQSHKLTPLENPDFSTFLTFSFS